MIEIKHRLTNTVLYHSKPAATVREALLVAVKSGANLRGAYLGGADLGGAYLGGADLRGAYLRGADLGGAYLRGADLGGADLGSAYLGSAYLGDQWIIQGQIRSDGYAFFLQRLTADTEPMVKAGCRYKTIVEAQAHWEDPAYRSPVLAKETRAIVRAMVDTMHIRGLK
jgi:hypothetical protein